MRLVLAAVALLVIASAICTGCSKEITAGNYRLGFEQKGDVGFYAFTTPLDAVAEKSVSIHVATLDSIVQARSLGSNKVLYKLSKATYVDPQFIEGALREKGIDTIDGRGANSVLLGTLVMKVGSQGYRPSGDWKTHASGVRIAGLPIDCNADRLAEILRKVRTVTGAYGANTLTNIRIKWHDDTDDEPVIHQGGVGWYLRADVFATLTEHR